MGRKKLDGTYYSRNKDRCKDNVRRYQKENPEWKLWNAAKSRAKYKKLDFEIEVSDIVIPKICPIYKLPLISPSLDRKDNSKGYVKGNVFVISKQANWLKSDCTIEQVESLLEYMKSGAA